MKKVTKSNLLDFIEIKGLSKECFDWITNDQF